jgi:hypothetical protein
MSSLTFDVAIFRQQFPAFANATVFPDAQLQMYWDMATCYVSAKQGYWCSCSMDDCACQRLALDLMTAHLVALSVLIAAGQTPGLLQNATIDKITVGLTPPPLPNQWQWWLDQTPYGQQLLALLQAQSVAGFYIGGLPEMTAFRKWDGIF